METADDFSFFDKYKVLYLLSLIICNTVKMILQVSTVKLIMNTMGVGVWPIFTDRSEKF